MATAFCLKQSHLVVSIYLAPLFKALGWDVDNTQGYAEAYKDVIHEDAIRIGSATKAPDYCFRIGGTRKFFVEAKARGLRGTYCFHYGVNKESWRCDLNCVPLGSVCRTTLAETLANSRGSSLWRPPP